MSRRDPRIQGDHLHLGADRFHLLQELTEFAKNVEDRRDRADGFAILLIGGDNDVRQRRQNRLDIVKEARPDCLGRSRKVSRLLRQLLNSRSDAAQTGNHPQHCVDEIVPGVAQLR